MVQKDKIENLIALINSEISAGASVLLNEKVPDFTNLYKYVSDFTEAIKNLSTEDSAEYFKLIQIWSEELKKITEKISEEKDSIQKKIETAMLNSKAFDNYNKYSN